MEDKFGSGVDIVLTSHIIEGVVVHAIKGASGTIYEKQNHLPQYIVNMWDGKRLLVRSNQMVIK